MAEVVAHGLPFSNELSVALSSLPSVDRASFSGLSVPGMRARIIAKADEYHKYTLALHSMQNALAPVHRLPWEVLSKIFIEAWQSRKSLRLTHVCRLWRSLLLDTSQFWAVAVAGDEFRLPSEDKDPSDEDYLAAACMRSAPRNLSLRLSSISSRGHLKLMELADRITSLQLSTPGGNHLERLWQALYSGMPRLEDLAVCLCDSAEKVARPHLLSFEKLPRLTRITIPAILFPISWRLATIQEITLHSHPMGRFSQRSSKISLNPVLESLGYYPKLKKLEIDDEAVVEDRDTGHVVELPTLERLRIAAHPGTVSTLLSRLAFPSSASIDFEIISDPPEWDDDDRDDWFCSSSKPWPQPDPFESDNTTLKAIVALIDQVTIENGPSPTLQGYVKGTERFSVRYIGGEYDRSRESELSLTNLFARTNAPVSHVLLTTPPQADQYSTFSACPFSTGILAAFPHLTHLNARSPNATSFLFSLSPEQQSIYSSYSTPRPSMPAFSFLEDLTLGFETPLGHESIAPLRLHDITATRVTDGFRQMCQVLTMSLAKRFRDGHRLSRLEFFSYEQGCMADSNALLVSHIDLAALNPELVEEGLRVLNVLVDGPVVFSGYRFFTHTPELPARMY